MYICVPVFVGKIFPCGHCLELLKRSQQVLFGHIHVHVYMYKPLGHGVCYTAVYGCGCGACVPFVLRNILCAGFSLQVFGCDHEEGNSETVCSEATGHRIFCCQTF